MPNFVFNNLIMIDERISEIGKQKLQGYSIQIFVLGLVDTRVNFSKITH